MGLRNRWKKLSRKNKYFIISFSILLIILIFLSITKFALYLNFVLGNDILVKLSSNQEDFELENGQEANLEITYRADANPFCKIECSSRFLDLSSGEVIEEGTFNLNSGLQQKKEYLLRADYSGSGQKLYRFDLECSGVKSSICNTDGEPTKRSMLITLEHDLSSEEKEKKDILFGYINNAKELIEESSSLINAFGVIGVSTKDLPFERQIVLDGLNKIKPSWDDQDYENVVLNDFYSDVDNLEESYLNLTMQVEKEKLKEVLREEVKLILERDLLCEVANDCVEHVSISDLADRVEFNINGTCSILQNLDNNYSILHQEIIDDYNLQGYPDSLEFNESVKIILNNERQTLVNSYLNQIDEDQVNYGILMELLGERELEDVVDYGYNMTPALIFELTKNDITCLEHPYNDLIFEDVNVSLPEFNEPDPICCLNGNCTSCCVSEECRNDPSKYPIIFLHGHDFNKDLSASYNLNGFSLIEERLDDEDGYLTGGVVSLSTPLDEQPGVWGMMNVPITLRGSYYFDVFRYENTTEILETKSENIDTYALRLNDLIEIVKHKTGKPKVIIVAHSMGGLVARRYAQVFGNESVDKMILIGTPNQGIEGSVATYCPILGEKLECRDMNKDSLFMNKLNSKGINTETFIIIGMGCETDGEPSDGIVLEKNAVLKGATEFRVNGTCSNLNLLHNRMLDVREYPETYEIVKEILFES